MSLPRVQLRFALFAVAIACLLGAGTVPGLDEAPRAWLLTLGFVLLVPALVLSRRRTIAPLVVAVVFVLYGGVSALVAVPESASQQARHAKGLSKDQVKASQRAPQFETTHRQEEDAFKRAALLTALAGLAAVAAAYLAAGAQTDVRAGRAPPGRRVGVSAARKMEMAGRYLVVVAFLGVAGALTRFFLTQIPTNDLHMAIKSFWNGGSYFLLVATFAIPGFGLWLQGLLHRSHSRGDLIRLGGWAAFYLALLVPTGQRGFAIALAIMVVVILAFDGVLKVRHLAAIAAVGIVLLGVTQAARNEVREEGGLSPSGFTSRLAPAEWKSLYASQLASFTWTVQVVEFKSKLHIPNPFPQVLLKPVPRQIDPHKSQGFGTEFTKRVYPEAARQEVSFAIPLIAESYYAFGIAGMIVVLALVGAGVGFAESRLAARSIPMVVPLVVATMGWCLFVLIRGDLANALVFASGWVIPLLLVARSIGLRQEAPAKRVVIDALQVAPQFSGVGRQVVDLGRGLDDAALPLPLTVRCAKDMRDRLAEVFPTDTRFHTPIGSSRPRLLRIAYQQIFAPLRDPSSTILVALGDQAPIWGRARLVFVINDIRRVTRPDTAGRGRLEALFYRTVLRFGARRADRILTISDFSRGEIARVLHPTCPVDVVACHPPAGGNGTFESRAAGGGRPRFVTVGALRGYKGHDTLLEALAALKADHGAPVEIVCIGGDEGGVGRQKGLSERARDLGVADAFQLRGWVSDAEAEELLGSAVATINPSTYEGYGLPVAESIASGMPTITSDIPPHREIAADAALYFSPGDAQALAAAIDRVARDPELRDSLAHKARARWKELSLSGPHLAEAIRNAVEIEIRIATETTDAEPQPVMAY
jgi:glycosyltransferase involved in cell wall biosynthesis